MTTILCVSLDASPLSRVKLRIDIATRRFAGCRDPCSFADTWFANKYPWLRHEVERSVDELHYRYVVFFRVFFTGTLQSFLSLGYCGRSLVSDTSSSSVSAALGWIHRQTLVSTSTLRLQLDLRAFLVDIVVLSFAPPVVPSARLLTRAVLPIVTLVLSELLSGASRARSVTGDSFSNAVSRSDHHGQCTSDFFRFSMQQMPLLVHSWL